MALRRINSSDSADDGIKLLCYGQAGTGKTTAIATAPRPFIFSSEDGLLSIRQHNIPGFALYTLDDLAEAYAWLTSSPEAKKYDTICFDSMTETAEVILSNEKLTAKDPRQAYGKTQDTILDYMRKFRQLNGKHIYITCHEITMETATGTLKTLPWLPGKQLGPKFPHLYSETLRMSVETDPNTNEGVHWLYCNECIEHSTKDRSGSLDTWEEPNLTNLFAKIANAPKE